MAVAEGDSEICESLVFFSVVVWGSSNLLLCINVTGCHLQMFDFLGKNIFLGSRKPVGCKR